MGQAMAAAMELAMAVVVTEQAGAGAMDHAVEVAMEQAAAAAMDQAAAAVTEQGGRLRARQGTSKRTRGGANCPSWPSHTSALALCPCHALCALPVPTPSVLGDRCSRCRRRDTCHY